MQAESSCRLPVVPMTVAGTASASTSRPTATTVAPAAKRAVWDCIVRPVSASATRFHAPTAAVKTTCARPTAARRCPCAGATGMGARTASMPLLAATTAATAASATAARTSPGFGHRSMDAYSLWASRGLSLSLQQSVRGLPRRGRPCSVGTALASRCLPQKRSREDAVWGG